ncbi:UPF0489 family protein, partial [Kroppenstedtia guangzhouensis]|uniref:UPF0489 family protein n=1 Tax=Kroppenstedtia guangzhouensis TaxID=1274356 RepID=UPI001E57E13D
MARFRGWIHSNATLIHVDSHHDDCIDGAEVTGLHDIQSEKDAFDISVYNFQQYSDRIPMRIDNFIFAGIAREVIESVIYVCDKQDQKNPFDQLEWTENVLQYYSRILTEAKLQKYVQGKRLWSIPELVDHIQDGTLDPWIQSKSVILDLDLDYFANSHTWEEAVLRPVHEIKEELFSRKANKFLMKQEPGVQKRIAQAIEGIRIVPPEGD